MEFALVNAYNNKARYKSLIARENIARWNITRHRDVLARFNMEGCSCVSVPLERGCQLDAFQQPLTDEEKVEMIDVSCKSTIGC